MKKLLFTLITVCTLCTSAMAFELGGLKFEFGESPTTTTDVQVMGRIGSRSIIGGGVCSGYAYRFNAADVFNADLFAVCAIGTGTVGNTEQAEFVGGLGLSPVSLFNGKLKMVVGYDFDSKEWFNLSATTLSAIVQF